MSREYRYTLGSQVHRFASLAELMAKPTPARSGDRLAAGLEHERDADGKTGFVRPERSGGVHRDLLSVTSVNREWAGRKTPVPP